MVRKLLIAILALLAMPLQAAAITAADLHAAEYDTVFYDTRQYADCTTNVGPGTLPSIIPEPYNGAFTAAGKQFNVSPALLAGLFTEENFTGSDPASLGGKWSAFVQQHPDPNSGWPSSPVGATGPFQFMPATWTSLGQDGNGDGQKDVQNLLDAAFGAANYAKSDGATLDVPSAQWQSFIFSYNHAQWYVDAVMSYYNYYNSGATSAGGGATSTGQPTNLGAAGCSNGASAICTGSDGGSVTGNLKLLCEAEKFDPFQYLWGGGHGDPEQFMADFNSAGGYSQPSKPLVDCSGLINIAAWNAYGIKLMASTDAYGSGQLSQYFKQLPSVADAQPGDILYHPGHVGIATNSGGTMNFAAHDDSPPAAAQISGPGAESDWTEAFRYIGPGSDSQ